MHHPASLRHRVGPLVRLLHRHPVLQAVERAGGGTEVHLVGGLLRDRLLGLTSRDADIVVAGRGREIAAAVAAELGATLVPLGTDRYAAFRVVGGELGGSGGGSGGWVLDLWDRRDADLESDLARRDFTVNSFAARLTAPRSTDGLLVDPFGGLGDLERRLLRATTPDSFRGDPLRILRLPRLLGQLPGFAADAGTMELARDATPGLTGVAAERVRTELALIFRNEDAPRSLALLATLGVYPGLWLGSLGDPEAPELDTSRASAVHWLDTLPQAARRLRTLAREAAEQVHPLAARMALTFAGLQCPAPTTTVERFAAAGYLTRRIADRVTRILAREELPAGDRARRHFLHDLGDLWPTAAVTLGAQAGDLDRWQAHLQPLVRLAREEGETLFSPPKLLDGREVQQLLDLSPGPTLGRALSALRNAQIEGTVKTPGEARELLKNWEPAESN